jgi:hypothetical protein
LRAGRISPDLFLLADHRNVGFAYPWIRPSPEFYGWLPVHSITGADVSRNWGDSGVLWQARAFAGRSRDRLPNSLATGDALAPLAALGPPPASDSTTVRADFAGLTLTRESEGLTLKGSLVQLRGRLEGTADASGLFTALDALAASPIPAVAEEAALLRAQSASAGFNRFYAALGVAYDSGPWLVSAEFNQVMLTSGKKASVHGFLGAGYRIDAFTLFASAARARSQDAAALVPTQWAAALTPVIGPVAAQQAQALGTFSAELLNLGRIDQRTLSTGVRWDLHPQVALELQLDHVRVHRNGGLLWGSGSNRPNSGYVGAVTMDFVF